MNYIDCLSEDYTINTPDIADYVYTLYNGTENYLLVEFEIGPSCPMDFTYTL